jgi:hypothetical protein
MTRADNAAYMSLSPTAQRTADETEHYGLWLTVSDIMEYTGYCRNTVYKLLYRSKLVKNNHRKKVEHRIHRLDFAAWWASR